MLVFVEGGKLGNPKKNPWSKARTNKNMAHIRHWTRIETWWKVRALTTGPSLLPCFPATLVDILAEQLSIDQGCALNKPGHQMQLTFWKNSLTLKGWAPRISQL